MWSREFGLGIGLLLAFLPLAGCIGVADTEAGGGGFRLPLAERSFELIYRAEAVPPASAVRAKLFLPLPPSDDLQQVSTSESHIRIGGREVAGGDPRVARVREPRFGNRALRVESAGEAIRVELRFAVRRREVLVKDFRERGSRPLDPEERRRFGPDLEPDHMVPLDGIVSERAARAVGGETNLLVQGRRLYDDVRRAMRYDKSRPGWGRGDAVWACDSRFGNCTDFHSVFIGMARSRGIPARFFMGFPIPEKRGAGRVGGYHCWASFFVPDLGWVPVDISEADKHPELAEYYFGALTENRVRFTTGRDLVFPGQEDPTPMNFFIDPYLEVDGKATGDGVTRELFYRDR